MKNRGVVVLLMGVMLLSYSCKSKKVAGGREVKDTETMRRVEEVLKHETLPSSYSARAELSVQTGGNNISSKGDLRILPNRAIYLSLQPFLGIELIRIVITPEKLLVIDRTKRRYLSQPIGVLGEFAGGVNPFVYVQSLFLNRMFVLGKESATLSDFEKFSIVKESDAIRLEKSIADKASYSFRINKDNFLAATGVKVADSQIAVDWVYSDFMTVEGVTQPVVSEIRFQMGDKTMKMKIVTPKVEYGKKFTIDDAPPTKYNEVELADLLKSFLK